MSDVDLLVFGCAVSFIVLAGSYVYLRERYLEGPAEKTQRRALTVTVLDRKPGRVA